MDLEGAFAFRLMDQLVVPTFAIDLSCNVIFWNKACERLTGLSAADIVGKNDHWRAFYDHQRPCLADLIALGQIGEASSFYAKYVHYESSNLHTENWCTMPQTGSRLYLGFDAGPVRDDDGHTIAIVETLRNLTADKMAQGAWQKLASLDGLTGLANRRRFDELLQIEWSGAITHHEQISLLMIDIDNFKAYNDHYGHQEGDNCLRAVADVISQNMLRMSDLSARYGGEEFAIVLPRTSQEAARTIAERIRRSVKKIELSADTTSPFNGVSVSIGIVTCDPQSGMVPSTFIARADMALYQAKHSGKDKAVAFNDFGDALMPHPIAWNYADTHAGRLPSLREPAIAKAVSAKR